MKIASILHNVGRAKPELFLKRLEEAVAFGVDVVVGPDYALDFDLKRPNSFDERVRVYSRIAGISAGSKTLILPGTISYPIGREMVHVAPVFQDGNLSLELHKERDNGESGLAENAGLTFRRGNSRDNRISFGGKQFAVEICGDHGSQDTRGCDIELILAYDKQAGFYTNAGNDGFARKVVLCDGYKPFAAAFDYNQDRSPKQVRITGEEIKLNRGKMKVFEI